MEELIPYVWNREMVAVKEKNRMLCGYVKIAISGQNIERFLNIAAQRELTIEQIEEKDGAVFFWTTPKAFRRMKSITKKTGTKIRIHSRAGMPFLLYKNRKRKLFIFGIAAFLLFIYALSFFIWDISVEGNRKFTDQMILHYLETIPVVHGMRKSDISCEQLEADIRNHFSEITWVSAEIDGTRLILHIKENEGLLEPMTPDDSACDLLASKAGTIVRIVVRSGLCQVKEGDVTEPGMMLVDGTIPIYDDGGTVVNSHEVHADAEIFAQTVHTIQKELPLTETVISRTGKERCGIFIQWFGRPFYFLLPSMEESTWEYVTEREQMKLFRNFYLPVYVGKITAYESVSYEKNYVESEVRAICDDYLQEYMEKLQEKGIQILGSDGKIEVNESGWQITGTLTVIENIAVETKETQKNRKIEENWAVNECD